MSDITDMPCEEEPETCILKTHELLSKAQLLLRDIEKLLDCCTLTATSNQRRCSTILPERHASIEEDGETLVIGSFRFESAASREDLRGMCPQAGEGEHRGDT